MKIERHSQIIRLIGQYDIETQEELAEKLNESGFQVTQATVSRDIRELKLTKISNRARFPLCGAAERGSGNEAENIPMCCVLRSSPWIWHRIFWW